MIAGCAQGAMKIKSVFFLLLVTLPAIVMAITGCFLPPGAARANEVGSEMMFDLWKYQTGEEDTGLLTGKPTKPSTAEPPAVTASITGIVSYRERVALLPNDVIEVQLLDISRQDVPAAVIAKQHITQPGQVPIPFKLAYDPAKINPAHKYAVLARILSNGQVRFKNTSPCYVITHGHPNTADVLLAMTASESAEQSKPLAGSGFIGTYKRTFIGAGGTVEEMLHIRSNETVELHSSFTKGVMQEAGVWSQEGRLLAVTLTQKNGEYINPERIVFELQGNTLAAVEYDRNAYGLHYVFIRTVGSGQKK